MFFRFRTMTKLNAIFLRERHPFHILLSSILPFFVSFALFFLLFAVVAYLYNWRTNNFIANEVAVHCGFLLIVLFSSSLALFLIRNIFYPYIASVFFIFIDFALFFTLFYSSLMMIFIITSIINNGCTFFEVIVYRNLKESYRSFSVFLQKIDNLFGVTPRNTQFLFLLTCGTETVSISLETMVVGAVVASASFLVGYWLFKWLKGSGSTSNTVDQAQTDTTSSSVVNSIVPPSNNSESHFTDGTFCPESAVVPANGAPDAFLTPRSPVDLGLMEVTGDVPSTNSTWLWRKPELRHEIELLRPAREAVVFRSSNPNWVEELQQQLADGVLTQDEFEAEYIRTYFENTSLRDILESVDEIFFILSFMLVFFVLLALFFFYKNSWLGFVPFFLIFCTRVILWFILKLINSDSTIWISFVPVLVKFAILWLFFVAAYLFTFTRQASSLVRCLPPYVAYNKTTGAPSYHDQRRYAGFDVFHNREDLLNRNRSFHAKDPVLLDKKIYESKWFEDGNVRLYEIQNTDLLYDFVTVISIFDIFEFFKQSRAELAFDTLPRPQNPAWRNFQLKVHSINSPDWFGWADVKRRFITLGYAENPEVGNSLIFNCRPSWTELYLLQAQFKPTIPCLTPSPFPTPVNKVYEWPEKVSNPRQVSSVNLTSSTSIPARKETTYYEDKVRQFKLACTLFSYFVGGVSPATGLVVAGLVGGVSLYFLYKTNPSAFVFSNGFGVFSYCPFIIIITDNTVEPVFYYNAIFALLLIVFIIKLLLRRTR